MLKTGQIVRLGTEIYRVDYVNECRARIIPLAKRHVVVKDDEGNEVRSFEAERNGLNISPNSPLEVVPEHDLARVRTEAELARAEAEERALRAEIARAAAPTALAAPVPVPRSVAIEPNFEGLKSRQAPKRTTGGWRFAPDATVPPVDPDSLKDLVLNYLMEHEGEETKAIAAAIPSATPGAVAACLDRFRKAGVVVKG